MNPMNLNPNRKTVFNPTSMELSWRWDGKYYFIAPNGTLAAPLAVAEHLLKHLRSKGLKECTLEESAQATYKEFAENQIDGIRDLTVHTPVSDVRPPQPPKVVSRPRAPKVVAAPVAVAPVKVDPVAEEEKLVTGSTEDKVEEPYTHCDLPNCIMIKSEAELENYIHCNGTDAKTGEQCQYTNTEAGVLMHQRTKHRVVTHGK
jgi:hypothetical protein